MSNLLASVGAEVVLRHAEPVMGTVVSFDIRPRGLSPDAAHGAIAAACAVLHRADAVFSLYRADSPMSRIRRGGLAIDAAPPEVAEVLELCRRARDLTDGCFDPWGMPGGVDPTGLVKGWAAREAAAALRSAGVAAGLVNAAGDIAVFGRPAARSCWRVGIRAPGPSKNLLCAVEVSGGVATSGSYERGEHLLDLRTGAPAGAALSATVCGPDLALADAHATALVSSGVAGLEAVHSAGYEAMLVTPERTLAYTRGFPFARGRARGPEQSLTVGDQRRAAAGF